mgnify:FL=1
MVSAHDLLRLPYTPDLTQAGIAAACRWLAYPYRDKGEPGLTHSTHIVAQTAVELAFQRHLQAQRIRYGIHQGVDPALPEQSALVIGGRQCSIHAVYLDHPETTAALHAQPELLINASALVSSDEVLAWRPGEQKVYLFAFILGQAKSTEYLTGAGGGSVTEYLLAPMPTIWAQPRQWIPLGPLQLKGEVTQALRLSLGGQSSARHFQSEELILPPGQTVACRNEYFSLAYLHADHRPASEVIVSCPQHGLRARLSPEMWRDVWLPGIEIILCGYIPHPEFARRSRRLEADSPVLALPRPQGKYRYLSVGELHPIDELLAIA